MLTWPHRATDWSTMLAEVEATFRALVAAIATHERVLIVCHSSGVQARVREQLQAAGVAETAVRLVQAPCDDVWARDHGPITVEAGGQPILLDFRFNGWGGRYPAAADDAINRRVDSNPRIRDTTTIQHRPPQCQ